MTWPSCYTERSYGAPTHLPSGFLNDIAHNEKQDVWSCFCVRPINKQRSNSTCSSLLVLTAPRNYIRENCHEAYIFCRRESLRITIFSLWVCERSTIPFTGKLPTFEVRAAQCLRNNYVYCIHVQSQDTFQTNGDSNPPRIHWQLTSLIPFTTLRVLESHWWSCFSDFCN